jgi:hypothetical protein
MTDAKPWRLWIDGEERTEECAALDLRVPALVYDVPHDHGMQRRVVGAKGFAITLISPSERLRALAYDGKQVHELRVTFGADVMPVPVQFHEEWTENSGVRKLFGCLASNQAHEPQWVTEPQLAEA